MGDEVLLIPSNGYLKYLKILRPPSLHKIKKHRITKLPVYKSIKVSLKIDIVQVLGWSGKLWPKKIPQCTHEGHNTESFIDLNYRDIWLINRK